MNKFLLLVVIILIGIIGLLVTQKSFAQQPIYVNCVTVTPSFTSTRTQTPSITPTNTSTVLPSKTFTPSSTVTHPVLATATRIATNNLTATPTVESFEDPIYVYYTNAVIRVRTTMDTTNLSNVLGTIPKGIYINVFDLYDEPPIIDPTLATDVEWQWAKIQWNGPNGSVVAYIAVRANKVDLAIFDRFAE